VESTTLKQPQPGLSELPARSSDLIHLQKKRDRFTSETFQRLGNLDEATKLGVLSLVNHIHPAAQLFDNTKVGNRLVDHPALQALRRFEREGLRIEEYSPRCNATPR